MFDTNFGSQGFREHVYIKPAYNPAYITYRQQKKSRSENLRPTLHIQCHSSGQIWGFPKMVGFPPNHPSKNRVFHYFHHPFWGTPNFWKDPYITNP